MGWVVRATPRPLYPLGITYTHCTGGRVGARTGLDVRRSSCPDPGFDHRTVQPVASRCTVWTTHRFIEWRPKMNGEAALRITRLLLCTVIYVKKYVFDRLVF